VMKRKIFLCVSRRSLHFVQGDVANFVQGDVANATLGGTLSVSRDLTKAAPSMFTLPAHMIYFVNGTPEAS
jgi:hypothetical protein